MSRPVSKLEREAMSVDRQLRKKHQDRLRLSAKLREFIPEATRNVLKAKLARVIDQIYALEERKKNLPKVA